MSTKSREVIWGGQIMGAEIYARHAREEAQKAALKCRSCRKGRYAPPVHMIKLTETRQIAPYKWVHPDKDR